MSILIEVSLYNFTYRWHLESREALAWKNNNLYIVNCGGKTWRLECTTRIGIINVEIEQIFQAIRITTLVIIKMLRLRASSQKAYRWELRCNNSFCTCVVYRKEGEATTEVYKPSGMSRCNHTYNSVSRICYRDTWLIRLKLEERCCVSGGTMTLCELRMSYGEHTYSYRTSVNIRENVLNVVMTRLDRALSASRPPGPRAPKTMALFN